MKNKIKNCVKFMAFMAGIILAGYMIIYTVERIPRVESYECPCGRDAMSSYRYCVDCGRSIDEAWCKYYPTCKDCKRTGFMKNYCPRCGSDDIERDAGFYMKDAGPVKRFLHRHVYL